MGIDFRSLYYVLCVIEEIADLQLVVDTERWSVVFGTRLECYRRWRIGR